MAMLADVAPYSSEYNTYRQRVGRQAHDTNDTELEIEYEKILNRVKKTRESVIRMQDRHFTTPVDEISGTVDQVSPAGITLKEFPGRQFQFSSVSTSAADMSARILGEQNNMTRCVRLSGHKTPRARALDRSPAHDPVLSTLWLTDPVQEGMSYFVSVLPGTKTTHVRARPKLNPWNHESMIRPWPLSGSLILRSGKASPNGFSVLPAPGNTARASAGSRRRSDVYHPPGKLAVLRTRRR
jgi:hypothetical protein